MSRTDHARKPRDRSKRQWNYYDEYNEPKPTLDANTEIMEQLIADIDDGYQEPLADWEKELLDIYPELHDQPVSNDGSVVVWNSIEVNAEFISYDEDEGWVVGDPCEVIEDDWDDKYGRDPYMPVMTIPQAYQELGSDGWHIEGKPVAATPNKQENYLRVWEIAAACGEPSKNMVEALRLSGEYVRNHMSLVAIPVAKRLIKEHLQHEQHNEQDSWSEQLRRLLA